MNLRAWIHNIDAQNYHLLPANTFSPAIFQVLQTCFCTCPEGQQSYQSWAGWYHLIQTPCTIFSLGALLLCSPEGTFGKVWWHKTLCQMLLSVKNTARSGKRQRRAVLHSTFIHELVRAEHGKARTSMTFGLLPLAAFVFKTIKTRETVHFLLQILWWICLIFFFWSNYMVLNKVYMLLWSLYLNSSFPFSLSPSLVFSVTGWSMCDPLKKWIRITIWLLLYCLICCLISSLNGLEKRSAKHQNSHWNKWPYN